MKCISIEWLKKHRTDFFYLYHLCYLTINLGFSLSVFGLLSLFERYNIKQSQMHKCTYDQTIANTIYNASKTSCFWIKWNTCNNVKRIKPSNYIIICLLQTSVVSPLTVETAIH